MNALANVVHFFANKFTGLRGRGFAFLFVVLCASNNSCSGIKSSCETVSEGQFVFWGGAILSGLCLSAKKRDKIKAISNHNPVGHPRSPRVCEWGGGASLPAAARAVSRGNGQLHSSAFFECICAFAPAPSGITLPGSRPAEHRNVPRHPEGRKLV